MFASQISEPAATEVSTNSEIARGSNFSHFLIFYVSHHHSLPSCCINSQVCLSLQTTTSPLFLSNLMLYPACRHPASFLLGFHMSSRLFSPLLHTESLPPPSCLPKPRPSPSLCPHLRSLLRTLGSGVPMTPWILAIWSTSLAPGNSGWRLQIEATNLFKTHLGTRSSPAVTFCRKGVSVFGLATPFFRSGGLRKREHCFSPHSKKPSHMDLRGLTGASSTPTLRERRQKIKACNIFCRGYLWGELVNASATGTGQAPWLQEIQLVGKTSDAMITG